MRLGDESVWRDRGFFRLWSARTISGLGSQVSGIALPLAAILELGASATQIGILVALAYLPPLVLSFHVGVLVDRRDRRGIMVVSDLCQAVALGSIPVAAVLDALTMGHLYAVAIAMGVFGLLFDIASFSYLPSVIGRARLVQANSALTASYSAAAIAGPGIGGALVQLLTAPIAIVADAVSFLVSATLIRTIRVRERIKRAERRSMWSEAREGIAFVLHDRYLRTIAGAALFLNLFSFMLLALVVLFATRELGVEPATLGLALGVAGAGSLLGSFVAPRLGRTIGIGPAMLAGLVLFAVASALVPLARGPEALAATTIGAAFFLRGLGVLQLDVHALSLRQAVTPDALLGRVHAANRFVVGAMRPLGSLLGGVLGDAIGLRPTLSIAAAGTAVVVLLLFASPLRGLREPAAVSA